MENLILFVNSFLSYILLFLIIVVVAGIAMFIGITMRKKSDAKAAEEAANAVSSETEEITSEE
ncbi:MAG: hypothetical protein ACI4AA_09565 [Lachnospiraceae bacterium]